MEIQKKHTFSYNKNSLRQVENLLPRLKHSVLPSKIIRWLENFDEDEVGLAIDLLSVYEYIPFNELMSPPTPIWAPPIPLNRVLLP